MKFKTAVLSLLALAAIVCVCTYHILDVVADRDLAPTFGWVFVLLISGIVAGVVYAKPWYDEKPSETPYADRVMPKEPTDRYWMWMT